MYHCQRQQHRAGLSVAFFISYTFVFASANHVKYPTLIWDGKTCITRMRGRLGLTGYEVYIVAADTN